MDNRSKILLHALELFAARGYDAVGVQEIVDAAGITKPTLYHYFGSKLGLLNAICEEHLSILYKAVEQAAEYHHNVPLTLNRIADAYFSYADGHKIFYRMLLSAWFAPPGSDAFKAVSRLNETQQQLLEKLFIEAAKDHGNMKSRHQAYAATFLGMVNTYIGLSLNGYIQLNKELTYKAVHQFMHGIFS